MGLLNILKRSNLQPFFGSLSPSFLSKTLSFRSNLQPSFPFTPLSQRRCKADSQDWWIKAINLATQNIQQDFDKDVQKLSFQATAHPKELPTKFRPFLSSSTLHFSEQYPIALNFFNTLPQDSFLCLRHLLIRDTVFSSKDIACLLNAAPYLQTINIQCSPEQLTFKNFRSDLSTKFIAEERHLSLKRLKLKKISIEPQDILTFLEFCPRLKEIDLSEISLKPGDLGKIEFSTLPYDSRASLEELYLFKESVLGSDIGQILIHFPNLKRLGLSGCAYITDKHISIFRKHYPKVLII